MKSKLLLLALIISLAFNAAFFSGYIYNLITIRSESEKPHQHQPRFMFPPDIRREAAKQRREFIHSRKEFLAEFHKEEFDSEKAEKKLDILLDKQISMERYMGRRMIELRNELGYEESIKLFRTMRERRINRIE